MTSYLLPVPLPWGDARSSKKSFAYWSEEPNGDVVVFVHGFNGSPVGTWSQFDSLLPERAGHDVVFYGYDSLGLRATVAASELHAFLNELCAQSARTVNSTLEPGIYRDPSFTFRRVILVAHSLGAAVCRKAMLDARNNRDEWASRVKLVLFAPAHMGAHLMELVSGVMGVLKLPLPVVVKWLCPVLSDLEEGSRFLEDLREQTERALQRGDADYLRATVVAICRKDSVVNPDTFSQHDAIPVVLAKDHVSICKPDDDYTRPVELVRSVIQP